MLAPNTHVLLEAHYGVPFAGAVLVALNTRLTAADLAFIVAHSGAQVLIYDYEFESVARDIAARVGRRLAAGARRAARRPVRAPARQRPLRTSGR